MENKISPRQQALRRKFYLALPALVLPFVTVLYWLWVVKPASAREPTTQVEGLLSTVPEAMLGEQKQLNKLSFYRQAEADSAKLQGQIKKDPYSGQLQAGQDSFQTGHLAGLQGPVARGRSLPESGEGAGMNPAENEQKVYQKLRDLDRVLSKASAPSFQPELSQQPPEGAKAPAALIAEQQLRAMQDTVQGEAVRVDPEIAQLNGMLDKILAIQDPDRQKGSIPAAAQQPGGQILTVATGPESGQAAVLAADSAGHPAPATGEGSFFSLEEPAALPLDNVISAQVDQDQILVSGQALRLRLTQDVYVGGASVPRGTLVYGKVSISGQRLMTEIESIHVDNAILPVRLSVYDLDGLAGIHIPDDAARQVAKQSLSQDAQGIDIGLTDPSLAGQAVGAGIQTAKSLLSRKTRLIQITLREGYRVLLVGKQRAL